MIRSKIRRVIVSFGREKTGFLSASCLRETKGESMSSQKTKGTATILIRERERQDAFLRGRTSPVASDHTYTHTTQGQGYKNKGRSSDRNNKDYGGFRPTHAHLTFVSSLVFTERDNKGFHNQFRFEIWFQSGDLSKLLSKRNDYRLDSRGSASLSLDLFKVFQ